MTLHVHAATDPGLQREGNEDSHVVWRPDDAALRAQRGVLLIVADGMGGTNAGEVASRLAVDTVVQTYGRSSDSDVPASLRRAFEEANRVVHLEGGKRADRAGMGTTCTALVLLQGAGFVAHVGDSRAYLIRQGSIRQLTNDHSLVAAMIERGELTPEQARESPQRNVLTRSIGYQESVRIDADLVHAPLAAGDVFLLCSDGLHGQLTDPELYEAASSLDPPDACRRMIALANQRGGPDNITVVIARLESMEDTLDGQAGGTSTEVEARAVAAGPLASNRRPRRNNKGLLTAIFLLAGAILVLLWLWSTSPARS